MRDLVPTGLAVGRLGNPAAGRDGIEESCVAQLTQPPLLDAKPVRAPCVLFGPVQIDNGYAQTVNDRRQPCHETVVAQTGRMQTNGIGSAWSGKVIVVCRVKNRLGQARNETEEGQILGGCQNDFTIRLGGVVPLLPFHDKEIMSVFDSVDYTDLGRTLSHRSQVCIDLRCFLTKLQELAFRLVMPPVISLTLYAAINGTLATTAFLQTLFSTSVTHLLILEHFASPSSSHYCCCCLVVVVALLFLLLSLLLLMWCKMIVAPRPCSGSLNEPTADVALHCDFNGFLYAVPYVP